jgi:hypothetical protein
MHFSVSSYSASHYNELLPALHNRVLSNFKSRPILDLLPFIVFARSFPVLSLVGSIIVLLIPYQLSRARFSYLCDGKRSVGSETKVVAVGCCVGAGFVGMFGVVRFISERTIVAV